MHRDIDSSTLGLPQCHVDFVLHSFPTWLLQNAFNGWLSPAARMSGTRCCVHGSNESQPAPVSLPLVAIEHNAARGLSDEWNQVDS